MPPDLSPTARALRTLNFLQARPGATADELAERLGVSERAARRYVEILREAGVPVESARGPYGGYRLGQAAKLPPVSFTQDEALGLVMAVLDSNPAASDPDDLIGAALDKVIKVLPEEIARQARALREHASTTPERTSHRVDPAVTSSLITAVSARQCAEISYRPKSGEEWTGAVDPWAVVVRYGRWYLLCRSHRSNAVRTYRLDRILHVQRRAERFQPPEDLDPVASLEEHLGLGWEFPTRVVFDAPLSEVRHWIRPTMGRLEKRHGHCILIGSTSNPAMYAQEWLASIPFSFYLEESPELLVEVEKIASRFTAAQHNSQGIESMERTQ
ncbi:helix-turn-helix transcriptional regulator [Psychromicrobium sp. YIM B11713]|uniref:helix-turn-helix transcriptional regulator n=1 Tax=Psychromicrobium sp. YIM B11713 TaxID=3145233 RepID=UPI00374F7155